MTNEDKAECRRIAGLEALGLFWILVLCALVLAWLTGTQDRLLKERLDKLEKRVPSKTINPPRNVEPAGKTGEPPRDDPGIDIDPRRRIIFA